MKLFFGILNIFSILFFCEKSILKTMMSKLPNAVPKDFSYKLTQKTAAQLRESLKEILGGLVFRRISNVTFPAKAKLESVTEYFLNAKDNGGIQICEKEIDPSTFSPKNFTKEELARMFELVYSGYAFFCNENEIRPEGKLTKGKQIYAASGKNDIPVWLEPLVFKKPEQGICPNEGDLICLEPEEGPKGIPQAKWWFVCSDQFMHLWTYVMHANHPSLTKIPNPLTGNYLQTNSYLKWYLSCVQNGEKPSLEEAKKKYFHLRTEYASREWVHVYCALYMLVVRGTLPHPGNVPSNISEKKKMERWDIPDDFVDDILRSFTTFFDDLENDDIIKTCGSVKMLVFGNPQPLNVVIDKPLKQKPNPPPKEDFPSLSAKIKEIQTPKPKKNPLVDDSLFKKLEEVVISDFKSKAEEIKKTNKEEFEKEMKALKERYDLLLSSKLEDLEESKNIALQNLQLSLMGGNSQ